MGQTWRWLETSYAVRAPRRGGYPLRPAAGWPRSRGHSLPICAPQADAALVVWAGDGLVLDEARVAAPSILSGVRKRAGPPVVHVPLAAARHLRAAEVGRGAVGWCDPGCGNPSAATGRNGPSARLGTRRGWARAWLSEPLAAATYLELEHTEVICGVLWRIQLVGGVRQRLVGRVEAHGSGRGIQRRAAVAEEVLQRERVAGGLAAAGEARGAAQCGARAPSALRRRPGPASVGARRRRPGGLAAAAGVRNGSPEAAEARRGAPRARDTPAP